MATRQLHATCQVCRRGTPPRNRRIRSPLATRVGARLSRCHTGAVASTQPQNAHGAPPWERRARSSPAWPSVCGGFVALELAVQSAPVDPEQLGGLGLVALGRLQHALDVTLLQLFEGQHVLGVDVAERGS
jgi:hypothetical protein